MGSGIVKELDLSECRLDEDIAVAIGSRLALLEGLKTLNLASRELDDESFESIF